MGLFVFASGQKRQRRRNNNKMCRWWCLFRLSPSSLVPLRSLPLLITAAGFLIGFLLHSLLFDGGGGWETAAVGGSSAHQHQQQFSDVQTAEHWERRIVGISNDSPVAISDDDPQQQQQPQSVKLIRARFAAAELGIRRRLLLLPLVRSPVGISLHRWVLSAHFDPYSIRAVVDTSLVDPTLFGDAADTIQLRPAGGARGPTHVQLLNAIANQTLQHNFDWFFLFPERSFVNPFQLRRTIDSLRWNVPLALGHNRRAAANDDDDTGDAGGSNMCAAEGGILLSASAMRLLVDGRNLCRSIVAPSSASSSLSEEYALEKCILLATNLSCQPSAQGVSHWWWQMPSEGDDQQRTAPHYPPALPLHDQIPSLASRWPNFNRSLTVSPLLSDLDVRSLLEHFVRVQISQMDADIDSLERELSAEFDEAELGWPIGTVGSAGHQPMPNRFQVPVWELFDNDGNLFGNDPDKNVEIIDQRWTLRDELATVVEMAKRKAEQSSSDHLAAAGGGFGTFKAGRVRQAYRRFDPEKGMEYMVDLEEQEGEKHRRGQRRFVRVQLSRPFHSTTVLEKVPFVKEDSDITIVVPVESVDQALSLRALLRRQLLLCASARRLAPATHRQIRFLITVRSIEAALVRILGANLAEMERKCKQSFNTDSALLLLQPVVVVNSSNNNNNTKMMPIEIVATDTAIDHYGHQTLFLLLSPFADFQRDFLDRVRVNTIRHFQVFFPIPFAEFNPFVSGLSQFAGSSQADIADFVIHKDRGRFDTDEFGVAAFHGTDFATIRARFNNDLPPVDLFHMFRISAADQHHHLHLMRPIEPSLRLRYHPRGACPEMAVVPQSPPQHGTTATVNTADDNCARARAERMGTRAQLARLIFANN